MAEPAEAVAPRETWRARLERLGRAGMVVYLIVYATAIGGFYLALLRPEVRSQPWVAEHMGEGSLLFSAWLLAKLLMIPRAALTCVLTPLLVKPLEAAWARLEAAWRTRSG